MNFKKILSGLLIVLAVSGLAFGQQLKLRKNGNAVQVVQGKKLLYKVVVNGKPNMKGRKYDEAFLAGPCLIVMRGVREFDTGTEVAPAVARLEIYRTSGKRRIYYRSNLGISIGWVDSWNLINSPDFSWAIIHESAEAMFSGYFHISEDCRISYVGFDSKDNFDWGDASDGSFIDAATLKFSSMTNWEDRVQGAKTKKTNIFITKDGKFRTEDVDK
jgi:hypothetical protein